MNIMQGENRWVLIIPYLLGVVIIMTFVLLPVVKDSSLDSSESSKSEIQDLLYEYSWVNDDYMVMLDFYDDGQCFFSRGIQESIELSYSVEGDIVVVDCELFSIHSKVSKNGIELNADSQTIILLPEK